LVSRCVDSVVLDERNTHAAAAFVSRFDEPLACVAVALLLRPLVAMRAAALSLAAGVARANDAESHFDARCAVARASTIEMKKGCGFSFSNERGCAP
jgi:hypothetical protein